MVPEICNVKPISIPQVLSRARKILQTKSQFRVKEIEEIWQEKISVEEDFRKLLKRKMIESGIGQHAGLSLHKSCTCSDISDEQFATNIANWLLKDFETNSLFKAK